jgi:hypothetical protein
VEEMFFALVTKCTDMHVLPKLANAAIYFFGFMDV